MKPASKSQERRLAAQKKIDPTEHSLYDLSDAELARARKRLLRKAKGLMRWMYNR